MGILSKCKDNWSGLSHISGSIARGSCSNDSVIISRQNMEKLGEKPAPVPFCLPKISLEITRFYTKQWH